MKLELGDLHRYSLIPISFSADSRVDVESLFDANGGFFRELPVPPREKDYDEDPSERPAAMAERHDLSRWGVYGVWKGEQLVAGAMVAEHERVFEFVHPQRPAAVVADIRVHPTCRGQGLGRLLFRECAAWAAERHCEDLFVETQDVNVQACRFYAAMGCSVHSVDTQAYGNGEARIVWRLFLR